MLVAIQRDVNRLIRYTNRLSWRIIWQAINRRRNPHLMNNPTMRETWIRLSFGSFLPRRTPLLAAALLSVFCWPCLAIGWQGAPDEPDAPPEISVNALTRENVSAFFDELVPRQMQQHHVPGLAIAVVYGDSVVFARGYGFANIERQIPVNAETSLFRIASVTKLFTWTAVMQLAERGRLDLNENVNRYLSGFQLPDGDWRVITLLDLMGHAAGFEDRGLIGTMARDAAGMIPLDQYLARNIPARIRGPGLVSAYSNYGGALAGHIVSRRAGVPYADFIEENILQPLAMMHATPRQPPPPHMLEHLAVGYRYQNRSFQPVPFGCLVPYPEGGISASAENMSRFMMAHLNEGSFQDRSILAAATVRQMHRQSFTHAAGLSGWAHGFMESSESGYRLLEHGGSMGNFTSLLVLVPTERVGLFVACNSPGGSTVSRMLKARFLERFLPPKAESTGDPLAADSTSDSHQRLGDRTGYYASCRSSHTTMTKIARLIQASQVTQSGPQTLAFRGRDWILQPSSLFRPKSGDRKMAFGMDQQGRAEYLFIDSNAWVRLKWYETPVFQGLYLGVCLLVFLSTVVVWPARYLVSMVKRAGGDASRAASMAKLTAGVVAVLNLFFVVAVASVLSGDTAEFEFGVPQILVWLLALPVITVGLTALVVAFSVASWRRRWWSRPGRFHFAVVALASVAFLCFLHFWNLLGWHF
jgi:CubicO group peptidase (beta-lactamase class C family)